VGEVGQSVGHEIERRQVKRCARQRRTYLQLGFSDTVT